jgi:hypothetical protein
MADTRLHGFRTALFAALGLLPVSACGGSSSPGEFGGEAGASDAGSPAEETGGTTNTGGRTTTGGRSATGGRNPSGGSGGASAGQPSAGTGNLVSGGYGGAQAGSIGVASASSVGGVGGAIYIGGGTAGAFTAGTGGLGGRPSTQPQACSPVPAPMASEAPPDGADIALPARPPIEYCEGGWRHRRVASACPSSLPRPEPVEPTEDDTCTEDADCTDAANGYCAPYGANFAANAGMAAPGNHCQYGCVEDSDCGSGQLCECGLLSGQCISASCKQDSDCGGELLCASYDSTPGCGIIAYACQSPDDECTADADCNGEVCTLVGDHRECTNTGCAIGRPFLIDGEERLATASDRSDWLETCLEPDLSSLAAETRESLAEAWTRVALMEHASIAAFARFTLELLAFGAPADLVQSSSQAMQDEIEHARQAFALASVYAGTPRGPGALDIGGSLSCVELGACVLNAFVEGCVGETVAALEAREASELATDPAVRRVLSRVADEEARHALLAFEFVKWALPRGGASLRDGLLRVLSTEIASSALTTARPSAETAESGALLAHGILPEARRLALRRGVLLDVVAPCLAELMRDGGSSAADAATTSNLPSSPRTQRLQA